MKRVLWFIAGADANVLSECPSVEHNRYATYGMAILITSTLASFSSGYAFYFAFDSIPMAIAFGIFWGFVVILSIDRALISTIPKSDKVLRELLVALPRILLALLLGVVIAKPLELRIFDPEIQFLLQKNLSEYDVELSTVLAGQIQRINDIRARLESLVESVNKSQLAVSRLEDEAMREADGTGGTMTRGPGSIFALKQQRARTARQELDKTIAQKQVEIDSLKEALHDEEAALKQERQLNLSSKQKSAGILGRLEVFHQMTRDNPVIFWADLFLVGILLVLESAPIVLKTISGRSSYDEIVSRLEGEVISYNKAKDACNESDIEVAQRIHQEKNNYLFLVEQHKNKEVLEKIKQQSPEVTDRITEIWKSTEIAIAQLSAQRFSERPNLAAPEDPGLRLKE